jgi:hypothetical protein
MGKIEEPDFLGSDEFVKGLQRSLDSDASGQEIPAQRPPKPLTQIAEAHRQGETISTLTPAIVTV